MPGIDRKGLVSFTRVSKTHDMGEVKVEALKESSFHIWQGELMVILEPSRSEKNTIFDFMGG